MYRSAGGHNNVTKVAHFFVKDFKLICFANHNLTLFFYLTFCINPHSGFEVALLLRPLKKILID